LMKDDFPTFDLPAKAISQKPSSGYWDDLTALLMKDDSTILKIYQLHASFTINDGRFL